MDNRPSVFISYNHDSSEIASELDQRLSVFADVQLDQHLEPWGSFTEFMNSIRKQDFVVFIISDKFLKSMNCLYEVTQFMAVKDWEKKSLFIVEKNAKEIYNHRGRSNYIKQWVKEENKFTSEFCDCDPISSLEIAEAIKRCRKIQTSIGDFIKVVADRNNPDSENAVDAVVSRVKIAAKKNSSIEIENEIVGLIEIGIVTEKSSFALRW